MEIIRKETIGTKSLSLIDLSSSNGGKWVIARIFRVVETEGDYVRMNSKNVINSHFWIKYNAKSKKQRNEALAEAFEVFSKTLEEIAEANTTEKHK